MPDRTGELVEIARNQMTKSPFYVTEAETLSNIINELISVVNALTERVAILEQELTLIVTAIDNHNERLEVMEGN